MSGWMSPKDLNDDPKRWLDVPHDRHDSVLKLQEKLFPGFTQKLQDSKVHCLLCEGKETFEVIIKATSEAQTCNGYIGDSSDPENLLLHTCHKNIKTEQEAREICEQYNATHNPGRLSRKMEYEEQ